MTEPLPAEDVRAARPYFLSASPLKTLVRRVASIAMLVVIDVGGLTIGLYAALALRAYVFDPKPILWGLLWNTETDWLPFLILLLVLVFWRAGLYAPRELREGAGRVVPSVFLVSALALAFAIGTGQHFTTFGLYVVGAIFVAGLIGVFRASYELITGTLLRAVGVRRKAMLVGDPAARTHLRKSLGASRGGIYYEFAGETDPADVEEALARGPLDELIVADAGLDDARLLEIVEAAHRRGVKVRVAPRTTELLIERGEYVPGQGVPLFELRPPIFAGADWATKRVFDTVVGVLIVVVGLPVWLVIAGAIKLSSRGPVLYADSRAGLGERPFRMLKFRTMVDGADRRKDELESANEAGGALFKIRDDPRVTPVGRFLRRLSLDEVPNVLNVLRGEMSLVGPRPLPLRDFDRLEPWHRKRYNVLPGMTGLWQVAGRSDLTFDDLVRLDFYYLENWSIWLDVTILFKTPGAVFSQRGAY
ncbi:MAG TPA: exopolysaccharide biosynthesis polyprenyl glycosylphosphotransferase [Gaiellaceae bacterium]